LKHGFDIMISEVQRMAQIAGIAKALNASVATRNIKYFNGMGVAIINPWDAV
jgi:predicted nucleic acid-binding protein